MEPTLHGVLWLLRPALTCRPGLWLPITGSLCSWKSRGSEFQGRQQKQEESFPLVATRGFLGSPTTHDRPTELPVPPRAASCFLKDHPSHAQEIPRRPETHPQEDTRQVLQRNLYPLHIFLLTSYMLSQFAIWNPNHIHLGREVMAGVEEEAWPLFPWQGTEHTGGKCLLCSQHLLHSVLGRSDLWGTSICNLLSISSRSLL